MAYLDGSTITVDAILTKNGRRNLARQGALDIRKFSLGDDGVDYKLFNTNHESGSNFYGEAITSLPNLEPSTSDHVNLRYHLMTWDRDKVFIPKLVLSKTEFTIDDQGLEGQETLFIKTKHAERETYTLRILNASALILNQVPNVTDMGGDTRAFHHMQEIAQDVAVGPVTQFAIQAGPVIEKQTTAVAVYGDRTGAMAVFKVNLVPNIRQKKSTV